MIRNCPHCLATTLHTTRLLHPAPPWPSSRWRHAPLAERQVAFSPSSCLGGHYRPFVEAYATQSQLVRQSTAQLGALWSRVAYGHQPNQSLALCAPPASARSPATRPLLLFIHGGYWQELSAEQSLFPAALCVQQGAAFAAVDYTLAPAASVQRIVAECLRAFDHLRRHARNLGFDPSQIVLCGSSAGAHLAAMVAMQREGVMGTVLVSGIYDLAPLMGTDIDDALGLTLDCAESLSPLSLTMPKFPASVVAWGAIETEAFKSQSADMANKIKQTGAATDVFEVPTRNHFDVILDLADPASRLALATQSLLQR